MNVTSTVKALPARVLPLPGESLASLLRRTAAAMGYAGPHRLRPLLADAGRVQANVNPLGPGPLLDHLAGLLRQPSEMLLSRSVHRFAPTVGAASRRRRAASFCVAKSAYVASRCWLLHASTCSLWRYFFYRIRNKKGISATLQNLVFAAFP